MALVRLNGIAEQGGHQLTTKGLLTTETSVVTYPGCTVSVFAPGTTTLSTIYSDALSTPKANPFTASSTDASFFFYALAGNYDVKFSGLGISVPWTIGDIPLGGSGGGGGGITNTAPVTIVPVTIDGSGDLGPSKITNVGLSTTITGTGGQVSLGDIPLLGTGTELIVDDFSSLITQSVNSKALYYDGLKLAPSNPATTLGTTAQPWASLFLGAAATNNIQLTGTATAARVATLPDATTKIPVAPQLITVSGMTAGRTWTVPDAAFSLARIDAAQSFAGIQTFTNQIINSFAGISGSGAAVFTGIWPFNFGTTNTKPQLLIEPAGTSSTNWSTNGTGLGVNAANGFIGPVADFQNNGISLVRLGQGNASIVLSDALSDRTGAKIAESLGTATGVRLGESFAVIQVQSGDVNISRNAAGILQIGTTAANALGSLKLTNLTPSGVITQTSASATAFESGPNGSTNPVLRLVNNVASQADGISISGGAAGAGTTVQALSSGSNSDLIFLGKGTGKFRFGSGANAGFRIDTTSGNNVVTFTTQDGGQSSAIVASTFRDPGNFSTIGNNGNVTLGSARLLQFNNSDAFNGSVDTTLTRNAAGIIQIGTTAANALGSLALTNAIMSGKATTYNNVATAGWGVPAIYNAGRSTAQTAAVGSVAAYTVGAADGSFEVSANVLVTVSTTHNFTVTCAYTDEGNTARTITFTFSNVGGTLLTAIINTGGAVPYEGIPLHIRAKASTAITIATTGTFTSVTYNVEGNIRQIA